MEIKIEGQMFMRRAVVVSREHGMRFISKSVYLSRLVSRSLRAEYWLH